MTSLICSQASERALGNQRVLHSRDNHMGPQDAPEFWVMTMIFRVIDHLCNRCWWLVASGLSRYVVLLEARGSVLGLLKESSLAHVGLCTR